ncbi:lactate utilization protein B/C [Streptomyces qinglanensis]|uniref:Lactate utilization protein B/C n=1 Tax=Streptomyces qinglanensis TaxID=943816 RepID=A0A1E7KBX6_9ACTN|nr:LUD domain-containing protein [Streptomyces qinglanensis]OEV01337.1 lactate utilization protein B/C [Streptomyces qinglanensis]OEV24604.1 lactate utilization protein B/C [Streptomyces nanshensis]
MSSRETVLGRVRRALADVPRGELPQQAPVARDYLRVHGRRSPAEAARLLAAHLADYRARVHHSSPAGLPETVAGLLLRREARRVVTPPGIPEQWLPDGIAHLRDAAQLTPLVLDTVDSVVTGCAVAVAETGTLVLDGSRDQGRRCITLVPDHHVCVVRVPEQVVDSVPQALERLDPARPLTWISGPSATSDIELARVEGVHGPRTLDVVLVSSDGRHPAGGGAARS